MTHLRSTVCRLRHGTVWMLLAMPVLAQSAGSQQGGDIRSVSWWLDRWAAGLHVPRELLWLVVMAINLAVLVWLLYKLLFQSPEISLPRVLRQRGQTIATCIRDAEQAHQSAVQRLQEAEASVARLPEELQRLAAEAQAEAEREVQRVMAEARREAERTAARARQEIEAATHWAQKKLQDFAAELALEQAERRIREHMTPETDRALVRKATDELAGGGQPV